MKKSGLEIISGFLAVWLNYIPVLLVTLCLYAVVLKVEPSIFKLLVLGLLPCGFYLIRYFELNIVAYFGLHILGVVGSYFLGNTLEQKIIYTIIGILFFGLSLYAKVGKKQAEDAILFAAMAFLIAFISYFVILSNVGEKDVNLVVGLVVIYIIFYLLYQHIKGFLDYIRNNEVSTKNIPKKHIFFTGFGSMAGFLFLFGGFAFLIAKGNFLADIIYKIKALLERFLIWLLSLAPDGIEQGYKVEEVEEVEETTQMLEGLSEQVEPTNQLSEEMIELIDNIVTLGAYLISTVAILLIGYLIIRAIFAAFKVKREKNEEEIVLPKNKVTKLQRKTKIKKEKTKQFSKEKKIRKLYEELIVKKTIEGTYDKYEKKKLVDNLKYQTPEKQCDVIKEKEKSQEIKEMYEKVRYSGKEATKEDLRQMKDWCIY